nr:hypothetical protein [uncultured bacterium]
MAYVGALAVMIYRPGSRLLMRKFPSVSLEVLRAVLKELLALMNSDAPATG